MTRSESLLAQHRRIERAVALIQLGARMQVLDAETPLPHERLLRLYREVARRPPSKGQLPFSADWFLTWQNNIHASLFHAIFSWVSKASDVDPVDALIKAYGLYLEQSVVCGIDPLLSITRAWSLVRFMEGQLLAVTRCSRCGAHTVTLPFENARHFVCGLCAPPARAGKSAAAGKLRLQAPRQQDPAACAAAIPPLRNYTSSQ